MISKVDIALGIHLAEQDAIREKVGDKYETDLDLGVCQNDGTPIRPSAFSSAIVAEMKNLSKRLPCLKKKHVSHHALRHAFATGVRSGGATTQTTMAALGHSSSAVTDRYVATVPAEVMATATSIDERRRLREQTFKRESAQQQEPQSVPVRGLSAQNGSTGIRNSENPVKATCWGVAKW
jgi:integrase